MINTAAGLVTSFCLNVSLLLKNFPSSPSTADPCYSHVHADHPGDSYAYADHPGDNHVHADHPGDSHVHADHPGESHGVQTSSAHAGSVPSISCTAKGRKLEFQMCL